MSQEPSVPEDRQGAVLKDKQAVQLETIIKYSLVLMAVIICFWAIYQAKIFLVPLTFAAILAMMMVPVSRKLESWGWRRFWSSLASILILIFLMSGFIFLLSTQASKFASSFTDIRQQVTDKYQALRQTVEAQWRLSLPSLDEFLEDQTQSSRPSQGTPSGNTGATTETTEPNSGAAPANRPTGSPDPISASEPPLDAAERSRSTISGSWLLSIAGPVVQGVSRLMDAFGDTLLALVYIFCLLHYRDKFWEFLLRLFPTEEHVKVARIVNDTSEVARKYLWGRLILILILAVLYGIGFIIIGLQNALFLALIAAIFTFVPYIGPLIGFVFPLLVALASQNVLTLVLGVLAVYLVAQFVESYILEPMIVGSEVNLNPFFTILAIVVGGLLWGVPGMILGIPILGIVRIVLENIEPLQPYAFLLGEQQEGNYGSQKG